MAIVAHVDHGKTTLVDAMLWQSGRLPRRPGRRHPGARLDGPRAREGHHDPRQEHLPALQGGEAQHHRHPRPRRLRRRGRAGADDGGRGAAARRRLRGPAAPDPLRAAQGAGGEAARDPGRQQGGPQRRPRLGGRGRGLRAVPRPRRRRAPDRVPDRLLQRQGRGRLARVRARPAAGREHARAAARPAARADPAAAVRPRPPAAGAGHQPRRLPVRRPPGDLPGVERDDPQGPADRLVPRQRGDRARPGRRALPDRRARPRRRRRGRPRRGDRRRRDRRGHDRGDARRRSRTRARCR